MHREDGAAVVEFALVTSLLVMVAWGVIQFAVAFQRYQGLQTAGREGARVASGSQATIADVQERVKLSLNDVLDTSNTNYVNPCPADPKTLATGKFCVNVWRRDTASSAPTLLTPSGGSATTRPCNLQQGKTVIVSVHHKLRISIPLWGGGTVNAKGSGEFKCVT